jgi:hypothetical protein
MMPVLPAVVHTSRFFAGPYTTDAGLLLFRAMRASDRADILARRDADPVHLASEIGRAIESRLTIAHYLVRRAPLGGPVLLWALTAIGNGLAEVSMMATDEFPAIGAAFGRHLRLRTIPALAASGAVRRVVALCADRAEARRYLEHCGARHECALPGFGAKGETYHQFAWIAADFVRESQNGPHAEAA